MKKTTTVLTSILLVASVGSPWALSTARARGCADNGAAAYGFPGPAYPIYGPPVMAHPVPPAMWPRPRGGTPDRSWPPSTVAPAAQSAGATVRAKVDISGMSFGPRVLRVQRGTTVHWSQRDRVPHTVSSRAGGFDSGRMSTGQAFTQTFTKPGTYEYVCALHPSMTGKVIVE